MTLLTRSTRLSRPLLLRSPVVDVRKRLLTVEAGEAASLLSQHIPTARVTADTPASGTDSIAFILHADRRPQYLSSKPFFGPSLAACPSSVLPPRQDGFGKGDLGIMSVQRHEPQKVAQVPISLDRGLALDDTVVLLRSLQVLPRDAHRKTAKTLQQLWKLFHSAEGIYFSGTISFRDDQPAFHNVFLEFDDFAIHRVPMLQDIHRDALARRDSNTAQAEDGGLFYIKLEGGGQVACFGYGAGNAMATMDGLALQGARPANFLDGGGAANRDNAKLAIETLHRDPDVRSIFVNTFGGLTRCSLVAEGIIAAVRDKNIKQPITVRLMGTEAEEGKEILRKSGLPFTIEDDFKTAAKKAVSQI